MTLRHLMAPMYRLVDTNIKTYLTYTYTTYCYVNIVAVCLIVKCPQNILDLIEMVIMQKIKTIYFTHFFLKATFNYFYMCYTRDLFGTAITL